MPSRLLIFLGTSTLPAPLGKLLHVFACGSLSAFFADAPRAHHSGEWMPLTIRLLSHYLSFTPKPTWQSHPVAFFSPCRLAFPSLRAVTCVWPRLLVLQRMRCIE